MEERAVIDRIVDGEHAVLLVGPEEEERIVPRSCLPPEAKEGVWLLVTFDDDRLLQARIDHEATDRAAERIVSKLERLRRRGRPRPD